MRLRFVGRSSYEMPAGSHPRLDQPVFLNPRNHPASSLHM